MGGSKGPQPAIDALQEGRYIVTVIPLHSPPGAFVARHAASPGVVALVREFAADAKLHAEVVQFAAAKAELFCEQVCADYLVGRWRRKPVYGKARKGTADIEFGIM